MTERTKLILEGLDAAILDRLEYYKGHLRDSGAPNEVILRAGMVTGTLAAAKDRVALFDELVTGLRACSDRFERCLIENGTAPEFAAIAVADYRKLLAKVPR